MYTSPCASSTHISQSFLPSPHLPQNHTSVPTTSGFVALYANFVIVLVLCRRAERRRSEVSGPWTMSPMGFAVGQRGWQREGEAEADEPGRFSISRQ